MPPLELPHWLMIAGTILVMVGLTGLGFGRNKQAQTGEPAPGDLASWKNEVSEPSDLDASESRRRSPRGASARQ
jgi:hypothetical protein